MSVASWPHIGESENNRFAAGDKFRKQVFRNESRHGYASVLGLTCVNDVCDAKNLMAGANIESKR